MRPEGIIVPIVTPMHADGSVDLGELDRQVERQLAAGVHGVFCFGTNGEGYALSVDEKRDVLARVVGRVAGRVPVYAGTGCVTTRETVEQSRMAQGLGADALSVATPWFAKASQGELEAHYRTLAASVDLPIVLYNIPARTGNALEPATVARLAEVGNIVGAKDSSGDWETLSSYIEVTRGSDFAVLCGNDGLILRALDAGAAGAVAGCANVYPETLVGIYEGWRTGDRAIAETCQANVAPLRSCFSYGNPNTVVKVAVGLLGHPVGPCRAPFDTLSDDGMAALRAVLADDAARGVR